ncbi:MAG: hypothetical protein A2Z14_19965 [Chloroflexi bacterium RBG_16_48_8]|nr:MAG: hypothetical protein A2Z14_19965 [Chloroflexi bacterium RBG_16_48_8]
MNRKYASQDNLAKHLASLVGFRTIKARSIGNKDRIAELLRNSWFTELLFQETSKHLNLIQYQIPWSMVQAYYTIYLSVRAYFHSFNRVVGTHHSATLRTLVSDFMAYKNRFPFPWCCYFKGDPFQSSVVISNAPGLSSISLSNPLSSVYTNDPWQHFGLFLKTTRKRQVENAISNWKQKNNRKNIKENEKRDLIMKLQPTSFFDALYRIRARSNYVDVDSFSFGNVKESDAMNLHLELKNIIDKTLFVFEMMIGKSLGIAWLSNEVKIFSSVKTCASCHSTVVKRLKVYEGYL